MRSSAAAAEAGRDSGKISGDEEESAFAFLRSCQRIWHGPERVKDQRCHMVAQVCARNLLNVPLAAECGREAYERGKTPR